MSQAKKDILNGWKEIGGYFCRDVRTVERWERLRGLPVRRVPGRGRATVYALISELDEWLESSKPDEAELSQNEIEAAPAMAALHAGTAQKAGGWLISGRWRSVAGVTIAAAAGLVCVLASPMVRRHANPIAVQAKITSGSGERNSAVAYRSQVSGVDDLYLRGVYALEQRTPESLERSEEDFFGAIAKDPNYAPAYAALANTYNLLREYSVMPDEEAYPKARAAAERAIALDPALAEPHASLGFIDFFWSWDKAAAEREFRTALALDPNLALAHHWYGSMLTHEGRYQEAIEQLNIAQRLEPTSAAILSTRALALGLSGRRGEAIEMLQELVNESPGSSSPHAILATLSRVEPRDPGRFLYEMRRTAELRNSEEMLQVAAAAEPAFQSGGERAMWMAILTVEEQLHPRASDRTFLMADAETALGRYEAALEDLTQLAQRRDPTAMGVIVDPTLAPLHRDRRFGQLVASIGLPPLAH